MVLQQLEEVQLWGTYTPNEDVSVSASWGITEETTADIDGKWMVTLQTQKAGGPYEIKVTTSDSTIVVSDVMLGEVWLASGQSNMEMPLSGFMPRDPIDNSEKEIQAANYPNIRYIDVPNTISLTPLDDFNGEWKQTSPETAEQFSATAYFFARKLYEELNVPIGIINSTWGGTPVESWISRQKMLSIGEFTEQLEALDEEKIAIYKEWLSNFEMIPRPSNDKDWEQLDLGDEAYRQASFDDQNWKSTDIPIYVENIETTTDDGVYWLRKKVIINDASQDYILNIEKGIDDNDITYVNGNKVGETRCYNCPRTYVIPKEILKTGENQIAIQIVDTGGGGGFNGDMTLTGADKKEIEISTDWKYYQIAGLGSTDFILFDSNKEALKNNPGNISHFNIGANTPSVLYNGMIEPILSYDIKGAIWYQGESNVGRHDQYLKTFPAMIEDWRARWNADFPFYFVQIAPFSYGNELSPALRDAQRKSLKANKTGMAVTMDIGVSDNIHPGNKIDVGYRLARWALANDYNKDIVYSGPLYRSHEVEGSKIKVSFDHIGSGLIFNKVTDGFEIAGVDKVYLPAKATINGEVVEVSNNKIKVPLYVRYGWKDYIVGTFMNKEGLPASSFSTD